MFNGLKKKLNSCVRPYRKLRFSNKPTILPLKFLYNYNIAFNLNSVGQIKCSFSYSFKVYTHAWNAHSILGK